MVSSVCAWLQCCFDTSYYPNIFQQSSNNKGFQGSMWTHFDFGLIWSFIGVWHFGPLFLSLSVRLHNSTKKGTFVLQRNQNNVYHQNNTSTISRCAEECNPSLLGSSNRMLWPVSSYLNMWEVALLELQQDLQSSVLVELLQGLDRPVIQVTVWHQSCWQPNAQRTQQAADN